VLKGDELRGAHSAPNVALNYLTLTEMAEHVRRRQVSPVELVEAHLAQIEQSNPAINAFVLLLADQARTAATRAEASAMRGEIMGPLHGVPVTVKDSFDMEHLPTTCGSRLFQDLPARRNATSVQRLLDAGAIILGKTNCPEFLASYETDNFITGRTNNPWDLDRTPGGSSGGEAAAIASFMSAGGIGSDGGGSIRIPAHFTGIAGLKPTPGRISAAGHVPEINHPGGLLGVAGPMARTASDLRTLFGVLAVYDPADPFSAPVSLREPRLDSIKVGIMERYQHVPVQPVMRDAVESAARALDSLGFQTAAFESESLDQAPNLWWFFFGVLPSRITRELIAGREQEAHWTGTEFLSRALEEPEPTARQLLDALAARDKIRCRLQREMQDTPVLLLPPCGVPAFRHRERRWDTPEKSIGLFEAMMPVTPFNLIGFPGIVIPWTCTSDGLPVGIQLVGRPYSEELLLEIALRMEEARGPFPGPPGY
jgi:Asp-tRNA(Asn)/Glu-tRNA(Gln) amidotransferase A subunit family amidase